MAATSLAAAACLTVLPGLLPLFFLYGFMFSFVLFLCVVKKSLQPTMPQPLSRSPPLSSTPTEAVYLCFSLSLPTAAAATPSLYKTFAGEAPEALC